MTTEQKIAFELQKIGENKLTNEIIIPLFVMLGYDKVEFNGGPKEEGKDIILWDKDKFDNRRLSVAQVKHYRATNTAADSKSFQGIVNQLQNCLQTNYLYTDQKPYLVDQVLFISSYSLDTATLQTRFRAERSLKNENINIIDGLKLAELLLKYKPEIVRELIGISHDITSKISPSLNNRILLDALGHQGDLELKNIYTDIDFSLGKHSTRLFFSDNLKPLSKTVKFDHDEWSTFKESCDIIRNEYKINFTEPSINVIEETNKGNLVRYKNWNKKHKILSKLIQENTLEVNRLRKAFEKAKGNLDGLSKTLMDNEIDPKGDNGYRLEEINFAKLSIELDELEKQKLTLLTQSENSKKTAPRIIIEFKMLGGNLVAQILQKRNWVTKQVEIINKKNIGTSKLSEIITMIKAIIEVTDVILSNKSLFQCFGIKDKEKCRNNYDSARLKVNIQSIFDTGHNFMVLGEAGAGKTTSLQMYAQNKIGNGEDFVLWIPLARVIQHWRPSDNNIESIHHRENLEEGIVHYLNFISIDIRRLAFVEMLKMNKITLLLDGIDEAIKVAPWLPEAIVLLAQRYNKLQLIVTTRLSSDFLQRIPFFAMTLMPFTIEQRDTFMELWFKDEPDNKIIQRIKKHLLVNPGISEIVKNPLLTTTLCVLAKHKLPLPRTEINLYNDRIRLLTGYYDNAKNIKARISVSPNNLEILAQRLALYLHREDVREMELDELIAISRKLMLNELDIYQSKDALLELIDPCNILVPSEEGQYGFGHLRYQEHLAARELITNRSINILALINIPWWSGVLILFCRMCTDIEWFLREAYNSEMILSNYEFFEEIIQMRPKIEQKDLQSLLNKYGQLERNIDNEDELMFFEDELDSDFLNGFNRMDQ